MCDIQWSKPKKEEEEKENNKSSTRAASYLRMNDFVPAQRAGLSKSFPADFTNKWSGPGVHWHVPGQIVMCVKNLQIIKKQKQT